MRGRRRGGASAGFILSETIAVMTISAFVLAGLVSLTAGMLHNTDSSVTRLQEMDRLSQAINAISRDIATLLRARWAGKEPQAFIFAGEPGLLLFPHLETGADGSRYLALIRFQTTAGGSSLSRADAPLRASAGTLSALVFGSPRDIYTGGVRLRFGFIASPTAGHTGKRVTAWRDGQTLPAAVLVEAADPDTGQVLLSERVAIRADADPGCLDGGFCGRADKAQLTPMNAGPGATTPSLVPGVLPPGGT